LDESELERQGVWARCGPPLRSRANVERLWDYVLDGTIDYHASDHAPYTPEEKEAGLDNIFRAPPGLIGNQYGIPMLLDEGYRRRGMTLDHFARYSATNAAKRLGLYPRKGTIRIGADADLVFYDLDAEWVIDREKQFNRHKWTPWHGRKVGVQVKRTLVRGETVYDGEEIRVQPGFGRFVTHRYGAEGTVIPTVGSATI
jgi:allantoinase